jgi:hypothetical protein
MALLGTQLAFETPILCSDVVGAALRRESENGTLSHEEIWNTLGCLLKEVEDVERVDDDLLATLRDAAETARAEAD